jgi:vanillate O-demethylase ferredoxin subunit
VPESAGELRVSLNLEVANITAVTPSIKQVELTLADGGALPPFTAGAHIDLELENGLVRSFSMLNDPVETHRYLIAVLRETDSRGGSVWVHDHLRQGDRLTSSEPINNFPLNEAGETHILIAGGIGITPLKAMAHRLVSRSASFALHYCARDEGRAAYLNELRTLAGDRLQLYLDDGDIARGLDVEKLLATLPSAAHVYVCGPAGLIRAVREVARDWPKGTVHYELFRGSEADIAPRSTDQPFEITLARTGKTLTVPADRSILAVLRANGIKVKTLCTEGVCGTCRVRLLGGKADHRDEVLTDEQREREIQVCVSRAMPGETLILDL